MLAPSGEFWEACWLQVEGLGAIGSNLQELCAIWPRRQKTFKNLCFSNGFWGRAPRDRSQTGHVALFFSHIGSKLGVLGPTWLQVGCLGSSLAPSWTQVEPKLALSWAKLGPSWGQIGPIERITGRSRRRSRGGWRRSRHPSSYMSTSYKNIRFYGQ